MWVSGRPLFAICRCRCLHPSRTMPSPLRMTRAAPWVASACRSGSTEQPFAVRNLPGGLGKYDYNVRYCPDQEMAGLVDLTTWKHVAKKSRTFPNPETSFCKFAPENRQTWPQKESNLPTIHFQWGTVSFREGNYFYQESLDLSNLADCGGFFGWEPGSERGRYPQLD